MNADDKLICWMKCLSFWASESEYVDAIERGKICNHKISHVYWSESIKFGKFESLIALYPVKAEEWIRFSRIFMQPLWDKIRPVCERHLCKFVKDCEKVASLRQKAEERIAKHKWLLEIVSAETLVIRFAYWLEMKYFNEPNEFIVLDEIFTWRNVLQECLQRLSNAKIRNQSEIEQEISKYLDRLLETKELEGETTHLFEDVLQFLHADYFEEMFCSQGWSVSCQNDAIVVVPGTSDQLEVISLSKKKSFVSDIVEFELPCNLEEHEHQQKISDKGPNPASRQTSWHCYTSNRFLERSLGEDVLGRVKDQVGFEPSNLLKVLLTAVGCYSSTYVEPRLRAKQKRKSFLSAIFPHELFGSQEVTELTAKKQLGTLLRHPVEPRPLSSFVELDKTFFSDAVSDDESRAIFEVFTADIHDKGEMNIVKGKDFLLLGNKNCYLFLPRFFFSDKYVTHVLFNRIMLNEKNTKDIATHFENRIGDLFQHDNFLVLRDYKLDKEGYEFGQIDALAFRDNTLFIIEAKMTHQRFLVHQIRTLHDTFQKAGDQLERALDHLPAYWQDISHKLGISTPYEAVRKVTLIVSNNFEYDHQYFSGHLKISWHELESVVNPPNPFTIFKTRIHTQATCIQNNIDITPEIIEQFLLFPDGDPSVDQMLSCLERSRYWRLVLDESINPTPLFTIQSS